MAYLVDTNLLLRAAQPSSPMSPVAHRAIRLLLARGEDLYLVRQNLVEFWVVATRTVSSNGLGLTAAQADAELARLEAQFVVLPETDAVYAEWRRLVVVHSVTGFRSYDARLVAMMLVYGVDHILTFNGADFRPYPAIRVIDPQNV